MKPRYLPATALILGAVWSCRAQVAPTLTPTTEPKADTVWTSTREVRALKLDGSELWGATAGGVLHFSGDEARKWTRQGGAPANEAFEIALKAGQIEARFARQNALFDGERWKSDAAPAFQPSPVQLEWEHQKVRATLDGLMVGDQLYPLPRESHGTHISALWNAGSSLLVAIYGDGVWSFDRKWRRAVEAADLPEQAREITALTCDPARSLWLGTRRDGVFRLRDRKWQQFLQPDEPFSHNIQNFGKYRGVLYASTLDDGLIYRSGESWNHLETPELSSSAPRQMQVFQDQLYVRHGGGLVDSFDGRTWVQNAFKSMPRRGVYALEGDEKTLFAAGWGGWSEWDGATWTPHFDLPELKGVPLMGLLLQGENLWIATQSRGLGRYNRASKTFRWFDERDGMPDDWITALSSSGGAIYAGTFVGGLARLDGDKWHVFEALKGQNVTAIVESGRTVFASTRAGIWEIVGDNATKIEKPWLDSEVQALFAGTNGLWIGARTSLSWLKSAPEPKPESKTRPSAPS